MATIANLVVEITSKQSALEKGLDDATKSVSAFVGRTAKSIARIGAITAAAMTGAAYIINRSFNEAAQNVDRLSKAAESLGTPMRELQRLDFAGSLADVNTDTLVRSMQYMGKNIFEAATQGGEAAKVFARLGLNLQQLRGMSADEQFRKIAAALSGVTNAGERTNLQMQIFGRGGLELSNLIKSNLTETDALFTKLGLGLSTAQGKAVEAFNDSKTVLGKIFDGFKENVAANVAPAFTTINKHITDSIVEMGGIQDAATAFSIKILDASIAGVNAFGELANATTQVGLAMDNIGTKIDFIMAGFNRLRNAAKGLSFANKEDTIPLRNSFEVPETTRSKDEIQKLANGVVSATNGVLTAFNNVTAIGKNLGEFSFKYLNPGGEQLQEEFNMINPGMEQYRKNQEKAAESTAKMDASIKQLTQGILTAKAEMVRDAKNRAEKEKAGLLPGMPGFSPDINEAVQDGTKEAMLDGKRIPLSTDPIMDEILQKQKMDSATIMKQYEDAVALRKKFADRAELGRQGVKLDPITGKPLNVPEVNKTPTAIVKIVLDKDGFFTAIKESQRFGNVVTEIVANAITDTATMGV